MDGDRTPASRELLAAFDGSPYFEVSAVIRREEEVKALLDREKVKGVVRVMPGFNRDILRQKTAEVQILVDGTDSNTASIVSSYTGQVIARHAGRLQRMQQRTRLVGRSSAPVAMDLPAVRTESRV